MAVIATFVGFITFESEVVSAATIYVGLGAGNHTASIQDAIDNYANDGDTVYVYGGIYFENVVVNKTINLTGEDWENTIIDGGGGGDAVRIRRDWVNVSGFTFTNGQSGIQLLDVQNCRVFNNVAFTNNNHGINLVHSNWNNITGNTALNNHVGISLSGSSWKTSWNNITGNYVFNNNYGISLAWASWNNITGNNVSDNEDGIMLTSSSNNIIQNNNVSFNDKMGIYLYGSLGNTFEGNTMINNGIVIQGDVVEYWNTHNIDTSNTVNDKPVQYWKNQTGGKVPAGAGQVILANCTNVRVEGQELTHGSVGIQLGFSSNNSVTGNNVSSNSMCGILFYSSNGNNIFGNTASLNGGGISLSRSSENNIISNMAFSNEFDGIHLFLSYANQIIGNTLSSNVWFGIFLEPTASNNTIYHNNFVNNTVQARDDTNNGNQWDNGYPSGGNFWSDWNEPSESAYDDYQGPNQDDPTSGDGIVDKGLIAGGGKNPYIIDPDSQDNYPLLSLFEYPFLYEGWNLISIPFIQPDTNLGIVLNSIKGSYDAVQWYNVSDISDHWKHNHTSKQPHLNDLDDIDHTMGFWIHITEPGGILFEYFGVKPTVNQTIILHPGWNHVGYPSLSSYNRTKGLNNLTFGSEIDAIWTYNAATQKWEGIGETDYFEIGRGYWIHSKVEKVWEVPL